MPTKARDYIIHKRLAKKRVTVGIHNGKTLQKRKITKNYINRHIGELTCTKKTGKFIHNNNKKKKKKK